MRRTLATLILVALTATAVVSPPNPQPVAAAPNPLTCEGYPGPARTFIELQSWWLDASGEAFPGRHVHAGACLPISGVVTGTVPFDVRVQLHKQPPDAELTRVRFSDESTTPSGWAITSGFGTPDAHGNLTQWFHFDLNLGARGSGRHELRLAAYVDQPSGAQQLVSSGLIVCVNTCSGGTSRLPGITEGRGWYTDFDYDNARFYGPLPVGTLTGVWHPKVGWASPSGQAITRCIATLDPSYHDLILGTELVNRTGCDNTTATLTIDPATLVPGEHKLVIRSDARANLGSATNGTSSGLIVVPFTVAGAAPTPRPTVQPTPVLTPPPTPPPTPTPTPVPTPVPTFPPTPMPSFGCSVP